MFIDQPKFSSLISTMLSSIALKMTSSISYRTSGPTEIPSFGIASDIPGNFIARNLNVSSSFCECFVNCSTIPSSGPSNFAALTQLIMKFPQKNIQVIVINVLHSKKKIYLKIKWFTVKFVNKQLSIFNPDCLWNIPIPTTTTRFQAPHMFVKEYLFS